MKKLTAVLLIALVATDFGVAGQKKLELSSDSDLSQYVKRLQETPRTPNSLSQGSLWTGNGYCDLSSDYKARAVGDNVVINIAEQTLAEASGSVDSHRSFATSSAVTGLVGRIKTGGINPLLTASSDSQLKGKSQTASNSRLQTSIAGRIVAMLPSGDLVVQARRELFMNNEHETVLLRGVVRPGDISSDNTVLSTELSDLEIELKGKGAVSEATRRPNWMARALLWLLTF